MAQLEESSSVHGSWDAANAEFLKSGVASSLRIVPDADLMHEIYLVNAKKYRNRGSANSVKLVVSVLVAYASVNVSSFLNEAVNDAPRVYALRAAEMPPNARAAGALLCDVW